MYPPRFGQEERRYFLSPIEALRVTACLHEAIQKLEFLNTLTPDVLANRDDLAKMVGEEITVLIQEQKDLERKFQDLVQKQHAMNAKFSSQQKKEMQENVVKVSKELKEKTSLLCRNLRDSPNISENIKKIQDEREAIKNLLQTTSQELVDQKYTTLGRVVSIDKEQSDKLAMAEENERKQMKEIARLTHELEALRHSNQTAMTYFQEKIAEKRQTLRQLRQNRYIEQALQPETNAQLETQKRVIDDEEAEWERKNSTLQQKFALFFLQCLIIRFLFQTRTRTCNP